MSTGKLNLGIGLAWRQRCRQIYPTQNHCWETEPTAGEIIRPANLHIAYLTQEFEAHRTVREEFWTVFTQANQAQSLAKVQREMETGSEQLDRLIHQLDRLQLL